MNEEITYGEDGAMTIVLPTTDEAAPSSPAPTDKQPRPSRRKGASARRSLSFRQIIGGEILTTAIVRQQIWVILVVTLFIVFYIALGYSYRRALLDIDRLSTELRDAKYRTLSIESDLTEMTRESKIVDLLRQHGDTLLHRSPQPPIVINIPHPRPTNDQR